MTAQENIETVKAIYEAFGRADVDAILERCTDDVDWASDAAIEVAPWHGVKHGKAEVPSFFAGIGQTGPVTEFTPLSFTANEDGDVMVFVRYGFTVTATGKASRPTSTTTGGSVTGRSPTTAGPRTPRSSPRRFRPEAPCTLTSSALQVLPWLHDHSAAARSARASAPTSTAAEVLDGIDLSGKLRDRHRRLLRASALETTRALAGAGAHVVVPAPAPRAGRARRSRACRASRSTSSTSPTSTACAAFAERFLDRGREHRHPDQQRRRHGLPRDARRARAGRRSSPPTTSATSR